jgi:hypothetical protein
MRNPMLKMIILVGIGIGCVVAWPIAKQTAMEKAATAFMSRGPSYDERVRKGAIIMFAAQEKAILDQQELGTQILTVANIFLTGSSPGF